jgi:hypothetical protein
LDSDLIFNPDEKPAPHRMTNLGEVHKLLEGGYSNVPQPHDTEKYDILIQVSMIGANVLCPGLSIMYHEIHSTPHHSILRRLIPFSALLAYFLR